MYGGSNNHLRHHQQLSPDTTSFHLPTPQLTRFSSAPTSFFQSLLDDPDFSFLSPRSNNNHIPQPQPHQSFIHHRQTPPTQLLPPVQFSSSTNNNGGNLLRQSSSPGDFFSTLLDDDVGFPSYKGNNSTQAPNHTSTNLPMPSIPEFQQNDDGIGASLDELFEKSDLYADCWQGNAALASRKRTGELRNEITFGAPNNLGNQNGYTANAANGLIHQMSLPNTPSELAAIDKYLQLQDPTNPRRNTRAKRGFATHPRSIAERVRRTKISDRMRKLQQLFPDIDKQTNTAQMLDMATDYIKDLEKEVQSLNDIRKKCICPKKQ